MVSSTEILIYVKEYLSNEVKLALVLPFPPPPDGSPEPQPARIEGLSRGLSWLFTVLFGLGAAILGLAVAGAVFYAGERLQVRPGGMQIYLEAQVPPPPPDWSFARDLPLIQKVALACSATVMLTPALAVLWQLRRLFRLYAVGRILEVENARVIGSMAAWLVAYAVAPAVGHMLVAASGFDDRGWLRLDSLQALLLGLVLFVIARVMRWGAEVADDAGRFV